MAKKIVDKLFGTQSKVSTDDYVELDLGQYETVLERAPSGLYVRVAELGNLNELAELKREIYDGNVLIIDISKIKKDRMLLDRAVKDLRRAVADVQGDIAEVGSKDQIVVTPANVKIDRTKIVSSEKD